MSHASALMCLLHLPSPDGSAGPDAGSPAGNPCGPVPVPATLPWAHPPFVRGRAESIRLGLRVAGDSATGTAGAICVNEAGQPFVLTCGHVLLDEQGHAAGQVELIVADSPLQTATRLWQCSPHEAGETCSYDAALVQVSPELAMTLCQQNPALLPKGIRNAPFTPGESMGLLTRSGVREAVYVTPNVQVRLDLFHSGTYALLDAHGYRVEGGSTGGDSGAPVRDSQDRLVGLHCGSVNTSGLDYNAVFCDIGRICFNLNVRVVEQGIRLVSATPGAVSPPPSSPPSPPTAEEEVSIVALTIWAEAGYRGRQTMEDVAAVIFHRKKEFKWFGESLIQVCRAPNQFPCWNPLKTSGPPMKPPTKEAGYTDDELASYEFARELATQIRDGRCPGIQRTNPPTHYHPDWLTTLPEWAANRQHEFVSGALKFYSITS
jgi:N-acetylmuramoyl-L-alanine amidase